ncbi:MULTISPECIES: DUF1788 domain-containing protein [Bacillaceae]|uniref:DUF1788 domain-containing protein n=1 Tax=Evansella alkalicola TaxID=745819 RepID=A0ABS6JSY2_9BACI|nr:MULTISPECIES: DUF1788 domain-containing protein [Bacillaceae]MBU9721608.1 DUF1788 domain-containing protein [Bacillus alkalicola]
MSEVYKRLQRLEKRIHEEGFTTPTGIGSEIPHYVFDYPPEEELQVRLYVPSLIQRSTVDIKEINLFQFLLNLFEDELDELLEISEEEGYEGIVDVVETMLDEQDTLVDTFIEEAGEAEILFITGVGNSFPFLRSSQILKMLSNAAYRKPIVLFYPGHFTGLELRLFNRLNNEDQYQLSRIS